MSGTIGEGSGALLCHCCYIILGASKKCSEKKAPGYIYSSEGVGDKGTVLVLPTVQLTLSLMTSSPLTGAVFGAGHTLLPLGAIYKQYVAVGHMTIHRVKWDSISNTSNSDSKKTESRFPGCHVLPHRSLGMRLEAGLLTTKYLSSLTNDIAWRRY